MWNDELTDKIAKDQNIHSKWYNWMLVKESTTYEQMLMVGFIWKSISSVIPWYTQCMFELSIFTERIFAERYKWQHVCPTVIITNLLSGGRCWCSSITFCNIILLLHDVLVNGEYKLKKLREIENWRCTVTETQSEFGGFFCSIIHHKCLASITCSKLYNEVNVGWWST